MSLPTAVERALADPFAFGQHADLPWGLPNDLPAVGDLQLALMVLEPLTRAADKNHAAYCLAKLATAFNTKWTKDEATAQLAVWLDANGDLSNDLWSAATIDLIQHHKFGMPKPVHLRASVEAQFNARRTRLERVKAMLAALTKPAEKPQQEPITVRLRTMIDSGRKHGRPDLAVRAERDLARIENRAPESWINDRSNETRPNAVHTPDKPDSAATRQALLNARLRFWKKNAPDTPLVDKLDQQRRERDGENLEPTSEFV